MTYKPFRDLILVRKIEEKKTGSGIYMPEKSAERFVRLEVLDWGDDVNLPILTQDIILAENMFEPIDKADKSIGLILAKYIVCKEDHARTN